MNQRSIVQGIPVKLSSASTNVCIKNSGSCRSYRCNSGAFEDERNDTFFCSEYRDDQGDSKEDAAGIRNDEEDSDEDAVFSNITRNLRKINNSLSKHRRSLSKEERRFSTYWKANGVDDKDGIDIEWERLSEIERILRKELENVHLEFHFVSSGSEGGSNVTVTREIKSQDFGHEARRSVLEGLDANFDERTRETFDDTESALVLSKEKAAALSQGTTVNNHCQSAKNNRDNDLSQSANVNVKNRNKAFENTSTEFLRVAFLATRFRDGWSWAPEQLAFPDINDITV